MCGIYGSTKIYSNDIIRQKLNRINYRGPDYSNFINVDNIVILGHNRLSIIDLDQRSNQPFFYNGLYIVFNGEIYNFIDLKHRLENEGYKFNTTSDTEVICASYLKWNVNCVNYLNGMFSFVIYDSKRNILFGSRDRLGKKPLYYTLKDGYFEFSSQPSAISVNNNLTLNSDSISRFLVWSNVPEPESIYKEVLKLKAGHYFIYNLNFSDFKTFKYWDIQTKNETSILSYTDSKLALKNLLNDATCMRMVADVPVGVFLSGGIDSSLISCIAQQNSNNPINTFSIKFDFEKIDESVYAKNIANYLGTNHTSIECSEKDVIELILNFSYFYDEPFGDSSALPTMLLSKHTKQKVTVALTGDGGDEAFLGYTRYQWIKFFSLINKVPNCFKSTFGSFINLFPNRRLRAIGEALKIYSIEEIYKSFISTRNFNFLIDDTKANYCEFDNYLRSEKNILERVSDYDVKNYLNNDINTKVDRASMAFSLECRSPLMDYRIIEFSRNLPTIFKYQRGNKKRILKDILSDYLPLTLFDRPKAGFGAPINFWFRNGLKEYIKDSLTKNTLQSIPNINTKIVLGMIENHLSHKEDNSVLIWNLLVLSQWIENNKRD